LHHTGPAAGLTVLTAQTDQPVQGRELIAVVLGVSSVWNNPYDGALQRGPLQQSALHQLHVSRRVDADSHGRAG